MGRKMAPRVTSVTRMKVISLFGSLIERWLSHEEGKIFTDLDFNLLLFHFFVVVVCVCVRES